MQKRTLLIGLCGLIAIAAITKPALAVLTSDNTNVGNDPSYGSGYSAFWRSGADYSLLTDGNDTYLNAPSTNGIIYFRANNHGWSGGANTASLDSSGNLTVAQRLFANSVATSSALNDGITGFYTGSTSGYYGVNGSSTSPSGAGVYGTTNQSFPAAGIYGTSTATSNSIAIYGKVNNGGVGVEGDTATGNGTAGLASGINGIGVGGYNTSSGAGYGVYGWVAGTTGDGVYGIQTAANNSGWGVYAINSNASTSANSGAIYATSNHYGVFSESSTGIPLYAQLDSSNSALIGIDSYVQNTRQWAFWSTNGSIHIGGVTAEKSGGGSWSAISDARVKKNVSVYTPGLTEIEKINPIRYQYNGLGGTQDDGTKFVGVIAQEVQKVSPDMVYTRKGALHKGEKEADIEVVDPSAFTYMLINSVKELSAQVKELKTQIKELKAGSHK
jgi:hypothetical protein